MSPRPLVLLALAAALAAGCGRGPEAPEAPAGDAAEEDVGVTVENFRLVREPDGSPAVRGVVVNASGRARSVQVVIALYGPSNEQIAEVRVPVESVGAGAEQGFNWTLDRDAAGASVRRILVF